MYPESLDMKLKYLKISKWMKMSLFVHQK